MTMKLVYNGFIYEAQDLDKRRIFEYIFDKYGEDSGYFITFHNIEKIGINPKTVHDTPNGIYAYPLDHYLNSQGDIEYTGTCYNSDGSVSEACESKYVSILKANNPNKILNLFEVDNVLYEKSYKILSEYVANKVGGDSKYIIQILNSEEVKKRIRKYAYSGDEDKIFWGMTRIYAMILTSPKEVVSMLAEGETIIDIYQKLSMSIVNMWNKVFQILGFDGVIDYGNEVIHTNEPTQAVFFNTSAITVLETMNNRSKDLFKVNNTIITTNILDGGMSINSVPGLVKQGYDFKYLIDNVYPLAINEIYRKANNITKEWIINYILDFKESDYSKLPIVNLAFLSNGDKRLQRLIIKLLKTGTDSNFFNINHYVIKDAYNMLKGYTGNDKFKFAISKLIYGPNGCIPCLDKDFTEEELNRLLTRIIERGK